MNVSHKNTTPFLKWAGGKRQLLNQIRPRIPNFTGQYIEPFMGAAAVFFDLAPQRGWLNDINTELVNCFCMVRDSVDALIEQLAGYEYDKDMYYQTRELDRAKGGLSCLTEIERAARFIYLNRTGFNGLYRVNSKGQFNVPFGKYKNPDIINKDRLLACHKMLKNILITQSDFRKILSSVGSNDFVYIDPPYYPLSVTSHFTDYDSSTFADEEQAELADYLFYFNRKNIKFLASNSAHPRTYELYRGLNITQVYAKRLINSDANKRASVAELLVSNQ